MKKLCLFRIALCSILSLSSCGNNIKFYNSNVMIEITDAPRNGTVVSPKKVELTETLHSIQDDMMYNTRVLPSIGDVKLLVVPIVLPGYDFIDIDGDERDDMHIVKEDLNNAFFGGNDLAYESVSSYYYKSSYGKLNITGTVTDWMYLNVDTDLDYEHASLIDIDQTPEVFEDAVEWVRNTQDIDLTEYDNDKDGYIDGIWCIYSCPNYTNGGPSTDAGNYWAYTSWGNQVEEEGQAPNLLNPVYNLFGWASYDFMYEAGKDKIDSHIYIHETGHFLGLNDYYSDSMIYSPTGRVDMMDANIGDMNSYSKMLLGWTKPYLVNGNAKIQLYTMENENNCIVIPSDDVYLDEGKFSPFSEYILIELYTNEGLNEYDSLNQLSSRPKAYEGKGVRIYHIDNRKFLVDLSDKYNITTKEYEGEEIDDDHRIIRPITNNRGLDVYNYVLNFDYNYNLYDEIRMIEASNVDTFSTGGIQNNKSYFKEGDVFSLETYGRNFFVNEDSFNNGKSFSYKVNIGRVR